MRTSSDIVIVGGGINGVSIAYHLAQAGAQVTLLEKDFIAAGPTGFSGAIVRTHYSNPVTARMALKSLKVWGNFPDIIGGSAGFTKTGFLLLVGEKDLHGLKANLAMQQSVGINTHYLTLEEIQKIEPDLDLHGLGGAAYEPDSGYCDPTLAADSYARAARERGVKIRLGMKATGIRLERGQVTGVETTGGFFPAGKIVLATGPWTKELLQPLGVDFPSKTARVKIGLYQPPADFRLQRIVADFTTQIYMRPEVGDLVLVGSISEEEEKDSVADPDRFNNRVDLDALADFAQRLSQRYPVMEQGRVAKNFASLYDITPDWHSIIDAVPGYPNLYVCAGTSGHGFKLAPAVGEMTARLVLNGKQPGEDIDLFAFDRFSTGHPVRGQYEYGILG